MKPSVAIIGAGPAGLYAAEALIQSNRIAGVDLIDELPAPFGLLRYGVAPDHLKMKSLETVLQRIVDRPGVRFFGNVRFGRDISRRELLSLYDFVVYAHGAAHDRPLNIEGENLPGSVASRDFVAWYNGHPHGRFEMDAQRIQRVAVIGAGNVALDVARVLAKPAEFFIATDVSDRVLDFLRSSQVRDIHILGRGSAAQARFTTKELRELGNIDGVEVRINPRDLILDEQQQSLAAADANVARNLEVMREWAARSPGNGPRRIHFRFNSSPIAIVGAERVEAVRIKHSRGADPTFDLAVDAVFRCVGYFGAALCDVPFDAVTGTIPNDNGRVTQREYVTGWARRGPRGVLGTNKSDAAEVAAALLAEAALRGEYKHPADLASMLRSKNVEAVTARGWAAICAAERALGARSARTRVKLCTYAELLEASRSSAG
ncbi:MAG: ferredoxin/flavodoxin---NADP+ reductase [Gammaproteobacteria bacterium]|nr:ferredoxin/flavodoxin---NADP+ reductase [Gammaproteobacteria bacterium]